MSTTENSRPHHKKHHKKHHKREADEADLTHKSALAGQEVKEEGGQTRLLLQSICDLPANMLCADCGQPGTQWVSINLGLFLCILCAGVHRSLGTHISKVKSVSMDEWKPVEVRLLKELGNSRGEALFEAHMPANARPPTTDQERTQRCDAKYVSGSYAAADVRKQLKAVYKKVGYGRYEVTKAEEEGVGVVTDRSGKAAQRPPRNRTDLGEQRAAALKALYGDNASITPAAVSSSSPRETTSDTQADRDAKKGKVAERKKKPSRSRRGLFGVITVSDEEKEQRLHHLLECFGVVLPTATPAAADGGVEPIHAAASDPSDAADAEEGETPKAPLEGGDSLPLPSGSTAALPNAGDHGEDELGEESGSVEA